MNVEQVSDELVSGLPSFVRWSGENPLTLDWWAPSITGDPCLDYAAGEAHLQSAFDVFPNFRDPSASPFYRTFATPLFADPCAVLSGIILAMRTSGPIECGFVDALTKKAMAGRIPPIDPNQDEDVQNGFLLGDACLAVARLINDPRLVSGEILSVIDQTMDGVTASGFLAIICAAALAGALH